MALNAYQAFIQVAKERFEAIDTKVAQKSRDPLLCEADLLGHLAWSRGLDYWSPDWTDEQRRTLINNAPANLRIRGTRAAIDRALEVFSGVITIEEWWEQSPEGTPGTGAVVADFGVGLLEDSEAQSTIVRLLARESRKSIHWTLILYIEGVDAIGDESRARITSLYQFSGEQLDA